MAIGATEAEVEQRLQALEARLAAFIGTDGAAGYVNEVYRGTAAVGTPEQIIENLSKVRDLGLGYAIFDFPEAAYDTSGIELFEREVAPTLA